MSVIHSDSEQGIDPLEGVSSFEKIAPHLSNPLILVGFALFLSFSIHRLLIKSGIIPPVARTDAPQLVKLILRYGFWIAVLIIVIGFAYATSRMYVSEVTKREPNLSVADFFVDAAALTFDIKLKNSGTDSAFVTQVRLVFFPGSLVNLACMPVAIAIYTFPFRISIRDESVVADAGKKIDDNEYPIPSFSAPRSAIDKLLGKPAGKIKPYWVTPPLRISQKVPPGDVDSFQIRLSFTDQLANEHSTAKPGSDDLSGCMWSAFYSAMAVLFYDGGRPLLTPRFFILRKYYDDYKSSAGVAAPDSVRRRSSRRDTD